MTHGISILFATSCHDPQYIQGTIRIKFKFVNLQTSIEIYLTRSIYVSNLF